MHIKEVIAVGFGTVFAFQPAAGTSMHQLRRKRLKGHGLLPRLASGSATPETQHHVRSLSRTWLSRPTGRRQV